MQNNDGSVLSILGLSHSNAANQHASPPSTAAGASYYGPANTSATLTSAGAFALGSKILASLGNAELNTYAADLKIRGEKAWDWAIANPNVVFRNNEGTSAGLGAGQQEVDDAGRATKKTTAAIYLFAATGASTYRRPCRCQCNQRDQLGRCLGRARSVTAWLYYANLPDATSAIANYPEKPIPVGVQRQSIIGLRCVMAKIPIAPISAPATSPGAATALFRARG